MTHTSLVGKPLAVGRTAEVYPWDNGWVIKLYRPPWAAWAEHEARIGRAIHAVGLPVPGVGDIVAVGERVGLLYERVDGTLMLRRMEQNPWSRYRWAQLLADLHVRVHAHDIIDLPEQRSRLARRITTAEELTLDVRQRLVEALETLCERKCLCHGDLHPGNVMLTARGPMILDWADATRGDPLADVARTSLLLRMASEKGGIVKRWLSSIPRRRFHQAFVTRYLAARSTNRARLSAWESIVAAARLSERIPGERGWLIRVATQTLD